MARAYQYSEAEFTLTSGRRSHHYVDLKQVTLHPQGAFLCGTLLFDLIRGGGLGAVGGLTLGADPLVCAVSLVSWQAGEPVCAAIVRKSAKGHGTGRWVEGPADPARPMAVLDDVVTTGKSTVQAVERLRATGFTVTRALAVVDRNEGGREALAALGLSLESILSMDDILAHSRRKP